MTTPASREGGFSLVEVVVALIILTMGVLALAASTMYAVRQTTLAEITTERSAAVQNVIEELRATDYALLTSGSDSVGRFLVEWTITEGDRTKLVELVTTGPGLTSASGVPAIGPAVTDTFDYRIMER